MSATSGALPETPAEASAETPAEASAETPAASHERDRLLASALAVLVFGGLLCVLAAVGAAALLVGVAVVQAVLIVGCVLGTALPGRIGGVVLGGLAAAGADTVVSVWPHGQLGALLPVLAPVMLALFVHQLTRGVVRTRVVESLSDIALLLVAVVALPAVLQLRHEFRDHAGAVVAAVVGSVVLALVVGYLVDTVAPRPHFDPEVDRGLLAVAVATLAGAAIGFLRLRSSVTADFTAGRGAFVGAALGVVAALVAVGTSFIAVNTPPVSARRAQMRVLFTSLTPLALTAPVAYLICLAVRG